MLAQSNNSGVKMNGGTDVRKPMRARKTMTPSSRRQMKMLNKVKERAEIAPSGASSQDKDLKNADVNQFLNSGALQDILYSWYENEPSSSLCKPVEVHLDAKPIGCTLDASEARLSGSPPAGDTPSSSTGRNTGGMVLEQESTNFRFHEKNTTAFVPDNPQRKRTSEDSKGAFCKRKRKAEEAGEGCWRSSHQKQTGLGKVSCFGWQIAGSGCDMRSSGAAGACVLLVAALKPNCRRLFAVGAAWVLQFFSACFPADWKWRGNDCCWSCSHRFCVTPPFFVLIACLKPSWGWESLQMKGFIQENMAASMRTWDHQLQHLHERIDHTQCFQKHNEASIKIQKDISRLNRRINGVIMLQKKELSSRANLPGVTSQNKILNCPAIHPGEESSGLRPSEKGPSDPRKMPPETTKERTNDVIILNEMNKNPGVAAVNPPAVHQEERAANADAATPSTSKLIIDLTDEKSNPETGNDVERGAARTSNSAADPERQPSNQADDDLSHLPPLPKSRLHQEPVAAFQNTLPPLKLDLSVVRVENPKGIALKWNVQKADPRCAPLESFHLFLFLKGSQFRSWQETNQILAKKLPMACTLSSFPESSRCYLAMRAKDIYGRYGPFSDIKSVLTL
ncbi:activating transcription factor 7-interacting protein 2 isoform X2 [Sceloporus undulatus]|uniref:activating transcription factor 7-interacting protein 2 isoform X2 n=1 Tax=Sceloporus undulatus TaxID=8520 RepID=UPI001C4CBC06|nr:activating transcription factor 7-interacting protein 2 isoform X2 [Sceloporus undulatus]